MEGKSCRHFTGQSHRFLLSCLCSLAFILWNKYRKRLFVFPTLPKKPISWSNLTPSFHVMTQHQGTLQRFLNLTMKQMFHQIKVKRGWGWIQTNFGVATKCPLVVRWSGCKVGVSVNTTGLLERHYGVYCRWLRDATFAALAATAWGRARTPRRWTGFSFFLSSFVRCCCTNYSSQNACVSLRIKFLPHH